MAKSAVLRALRILGLEEIQNLSRFLGIKQNQLKKAAGEELIVWTEDEPVSAPVKIQQQEEGKVLAFKRQKPEEFEPIKDPKAPPPVEALKEGEEDDDENRVFLISSDQLLWQRELSKDSEYHLHKQQAVTGYKKATEMYVVKTKELDGNEKIRFASTKGVLVNKKQA